MPFAFVFPGQGSQSVGMLAALAAADASVRATFDEASAVLGYDLWELVQEGPAERLNSTEVTQPAMLVAGIATARLWQVRGGAAPAVVSGHSLGEFTALVQAGAIPIFLPGHSRRVSHWRATLSQRDARGTALTDHFSRAPAAGLNTLLLK